MTLNELNFSPEQFDALRQLVCERAEANRLAAAKLAAEEEARKLDREKAIAKADEEERLKRVREEVWGKNRQAGGEGVTAWDRGK